jgi:16S rRNA (guanine527-N7)-methyltransferase
MNNLFTSHHLTLTPDQESQFSKLCELFIDWNQKINLSAIRDKEGIYEKHFVDSLLAMKFMDFHKKNVLDLGAGGGFPTLPLAIMNPDARFYSLDSVGKKMKVVQDIADTLKLPVKTLTGRIEDFGQDNVFREQFDVVTARALAPWPILLEYALPFVKLGGYFLAYQGPAILEDLKTYKGLEDLLGGAIEKVVEDKLGKGDIRYFVLICKKKYCPNKYPRRVGEPKGNPLKGR